MASKEERRPAGAAGRLRLVEQLSRLRARQQTWRRRRLAAGRSISSHFKQGRVPTGFSNW